MNQNKVLDKVEFPEDLRKLTIEELQELCKEIRQYIIDVVSQKGGHFGGNLGAVELTIAIHYVYNTPYDLLVWDVGHQAYPHKIITGRKKLFPTIRQYKGLSGFPKIDESIYDTFGVGHSSTSIAAALGMAIASDYLKENRKIVVVIGDGAITAGLAFEGINNLGILKKDILIILNDNNISIDPNVGAIKEYLARLTASGIYNKVRDKIWRILGKLGALKEPSRDLASRIDKALKAIIQKEANFFESMGIRYFGPIDGHNLKRLIEVLKDLREIPGPKLLHVKTIKGKGYLPAEKGDPTYWHSPVAPFDISTGKPIITSSKPPLPKYQDVFGETLCELAEINPKIMGITPAMPTGSSLKIFMNKYPDRAFDVGIAEQCAVTLSAGLAYKGLIPYCAIYSTFLQRAYDQVIHDVALQNLKVIFCIDRGGLVGQDGPTHHGAFDMAYLRIIPNMIVSAPLNEIELRNLMYTAQLNKVKSPFAIRYPRGEGTTHNWKQPFQEIEIGKGQVICEGEDLLFLSIGHIGNTVIKCIKKLNEFGIHPGHYDMRFVKPLDEELLRKGTLKYKYIITIEDGCLMGGFGSAILEWLSDNNIHKKVVRLGIPDRFISHGKPQELYAEINLDENAIIKTVLSLLGHTVKIKSNGF